MQNILLVDDDVHITNINRQMISKEGYNVFTALTVKESLEIVDNNQIDLIVLDINLSDGDGVTLCREIRMSKSIPIIFLSAMRENNDIIVGLDAGGDDYMTKPYDVSVLLARIKARLRTRDTSITTTQIEDLVLDITGATVSYKNNDLLFTKREFLLLWQLVINQGVVVSRESLYTKVWRSEPIDDYNALRVIVSRVNKKLFDVGSTVKIHSKRQKGYILTFGVNQNL